MLFKGVRRSLRLHWYISLKQTYNLLNIISVLLLLGNHNIFSVFISCIVEYYIIKGQSNVGYDMMMMTTLQQDFFQFLNTI